jgi:hypothetical protein
MKRPVSSIGVCLIAALAFGAFASATASAENPEILPLPTTTAPLRFTSDSVINSKPDIATTRVMLIICTQARNTGEFTSSDSGTITIDLENCTLGTTKCKTGVDAAGVILMDKESLQFVTFKAGMSLELGIVITLPAAVKITCGIVTVEARGSVMGKMDNIKGLEKTKNALALFHEKPGEQELTECERLEVFCKGKTFKLEADFGGGFELTGLEFEDNIKAQKMYEVHF